MSLNISIITISVNRWNSAIKKTKISRTENPALNCSQDTPKTKALRELLSKQSSPYYCCLIFLPCWFSYNPTNWTLLLLWLIQKLIIFFTLYLSFHLRPTCHLQRALPTPASSSSLTSSHYSRCSHHCTHYPPTGQTLFSPLAPYVYLQHVFHFYILYNLQFLSFFLLSASLYVNINAKRTRIAACFVLCRTPCA